MERPQDIEVELTLLPTDHGGRREPDFSGYRPQFYYGGEDWDAVQTYVDVDEVRPGETTTARLSFVSPEAHAGRVFVRKPFLIREGQRGMGYGRVIRILGLPGAKSER